MSELPSDLVPDNIQKLKAYQPGKPIEELQRELGLDNIIKIASNENPMGPSPKALEAAARAMANVNEYPDGGAFALRRALADRDGVDPSELVFGAGSNEIIYMVMQAFCRPGDEVLTHKYAFISYRLAAAAQNLTFVESEVTPELGCDIDALVAGITAKTKVIFLANPNNPTGAHVGVTEFERLLEAIPERVLLVVDEAYHEYAVATGADYPRSQTYRSDTRPLLVTLRTFSKIYGLAGMRVGYALADRRIADFINRVRRPFNVNSVAQAAALAALDDQAHVEASSAAARSGIPALSEAVTALGLTAYPSLGNFVLVDVQRDTAPVYDALLRRGVIVRPMAAWGLATHIRISVGTTAQTSRVIEALRAVLA